MSKSITQKDIALVALATNNLTSFPGREGLLRYFFSETSKSPGPKYLLLTTFNMDAEFFCEEVISQIPRDCKAVIFCSPFAAHKISNTAGVRRTNIRLVKARTRVFHPKFLIAISGENILVGVGSANLTKGGWGGHNQELFHLYGRMTDAKGKNIPPLSRGIAKFCSDYLGKLCDREVHCESRMDRSLLLKIKDIMDAATKKSVHQETAELIHNYDQHFMSFLKERKIKDVKHIYIFSPIHFRTIASEDDIVDAPAEDTGSIDYALFNSFQRLFPKARISFYSSDEVDRKYINKGNFLTFYQNPQKKSHLKLIIIETSHEAYVLSGSANFSNNAFLKKASSCNSELMLFEIMSRKKAEKIRTLIVGKTQALQKGAIYDIINRRAWNPPASLICQMDIIQKSKGSYEAVIYRNPDMNRPVKVQIMYAMAYEGKEDSKKKGPKVELSKDRTSIPCKRSWSKLINDMPMFCYYEAPSIKLWFPVNYEIDEDTGTCMTELDREEADLFSFFGCKRGRGGSIRKIYDNGNGEDDAEPENKYQSKNDKFYHAWKYIYHFMKKFKNKKNGILYNAGKEQIKKFLDYHEKAKRTVGSLTSAQVEFVKTHILNA